MMLKALLAHSIRTGQFRLTTSPPPAQEMICKLLDECPMKLLPGTWRNEIANRYSQVGSVRLCHAIFPSIDEDHLWIGKRTLSFFSVGNGDVLAYHIEHGSGSAVVVYVGHDPECNMVVSDSIDEFFLALYIEQCVLGSISLPSMETTPSPYRTCSIRSGRLKQISLELM